MLKGSHWFQCRQCRTTYRGRVIVRLAWKADGEPVFNVEKNVGEIPIMVKVSSTGWSGFVLICGQGTVERLSVTMWQKS